ncbi:PVC-type heme-binding CxxCH protein [Parafilimonas sp.]|uniref:PVC-type heme-binding CxxCH protein n=1 Tax=Parafilimonas sp. TaxID=1969739 RepID=UPI003F7FDCC5
MNRSLPFICLAISFLISCKNNTNKTSETKVDTLTEAQQHLAENALKGLEAFDGLAVRTFATEPMLKNPTNIDVDERGRVWVTEAYNYRPAINGNPTNAAGDRIMILEDNNGDGRADTAKVFYQGPELNAPLGICVLGKQVLISQSPYVWAFYDDDGDDKADRKEVMFSGIGGEQHDHGMHTFTFGADGKLYFNFGNEGRQLKDKNGKPVLDQDGDPIDSKKYKQGMVFRCNPDGSHVECLGQNFRNPYEVAVDSYGTLWQSDNDDDGNRGVRINYVMDYGNYGYTDEMTGAGWQANRTNIEDSIPFRHWHLNDPGEVPNLLQTGAGSPTGIVVYEGSLLPKEFQGQLIHCDAGTNIVRSYSVTKNGAGYAAKIINILEGEKDKWFRPADICVAPDGSLIVADWYDPGVGGHQAGDQTRGRIYRIAPPKSDYTIPKENYSTPEGAITALQNANLSVRYHAFTTLQSMGTEAVPALEKLWNDENANPRMRARAFWVLIKMKNANAQQYIQQAIKSNNPDLRITGLRAARELNADVLNVVKQLVNDSDAQVRRECAIALHHNKSAEAPELWATLAMQHDGKDRWYLEALGIGADKQWNAFFKAYLNQVKDPLQSAASRDIVWRARTDEAVPCLARLASDKDIPVQNRLRYFRAFDFNTGSAKSSYLVKMITDNTSNDVSLNKLVLHALDVKTVQHSAAAQKALADVIESVQRTPEYIEFVKQYEVKAENKNLLQLAIDSANAGLGRDAARLLLTLKGAALVQKVLNGKDTLQTKALLAALSGVGSKESIDIIQKVALSPGYPINIRKDAAGKIGKSWGGEDRVLEILKAKKVPAELVPDVVSSVSGAWRGSVKSKAESYLPGHTTTALKKAPTMNELAAIKADAAKGKVIFMNTCSVCHVAGNEGKDFGPKLTEIGSKYAKDGLLDAIVHPSDGISFGYEGWEIKMKDGSVMSGIIASNTETAMEVKFPGGTTQQIKTNEVASKKEMKTSLMPEGLYQNLSNEDLANLLEYLEGLKKK